MKRILIIGIPGAGKSTFAKRLAEKIKLPVIHLDQQYWKSGWVEPKGEDWEKRVEEVSSAAEWIIDGNYSSTFNRRFPKADTIFILDYSPFLAMFRATKRIIKYYGKTRPDMTEGCDERFCWEFYKFMWGFNKNHKKRTEEALVQYAADKKVIRFKGPWELEKYFKRLTL